MGRESELGLLTVLVESLQTGDSIVALLSGEAGIGKTALLSEAVEQSRERGYTVLSGRAVELEQDLPFGVFANAFEAMLDVDSQPLQELHAADRALLASAFPSLLPSSPGGAQIPQPDERHRLLQAIQRLIEALAGGRPLTLALDDLHWADPASIDLICRLLHRPLVSPMLLLLATRPTQTEPRLLAALGEAERHAKAVRTDLSPLSVADAEKLLGAEIAPPLRAELHRQSGGNPFYLEQLAAATRLGGASAAQEAEGDAPWLGVPVPVSAAIRDQLEHLSLPAKTLLEGGSLLGETFDHELAATIAGLDGDELGVLDELLESGLIAGSDAARSFRFRHPIIQRAVYELAGASWRLAAHARAAAALEAVGAAALMRAPHVEKSAALGDESAAATLIQAGEETASRSPASAAHWFEAALRLLPEREENLEQRQGLLIQRAIALGKAGSLRESREALSDFLVLAPHSNPLRVRATIFASMLDELLGSQAVGRKLLLDELERVPDENGPQAAELMCELAFSSFIDADWQRTRDWASKALDAECEGMIAVGGTFRARRRRAWPRRSRADTARR